MTEQFREKRTTPSQEESLALMRLSLEHALQKFQSELATIKEWQKCHEQEARPLLEAADEIVALAGNLRWLTTTRKWAILSAGVLIGMASVMLALLFYHDAIVHALML